MLLISKNSPLGYWALILRNKRKATSPTQVQDWAPLFPGAGPRRVSASHLEPGLDYFSGSCGGFNKRVEVTYLASGRPFLNIRPFPVTLPKAWITETGSAWWLEGPWWRGKCKYLILSSIRNGLPRWCSGKESACQCRRFGRHGFYPWVRKIPWRRKWQPTRVFLPGKFHGQRNLADYSPWGHKELDMT